MTALSIYLLSLDYSLKAAAFGTAPLWVCRWAAQSDYRSFHAAALWPRELFPRGQERIDPEKAPPTFVNQEAFPEKVDLQKVRALHFPDARPLLIIGLDHEVDHNSRHRHIEPNGKGHLSQPAMDPPFSSNPFAKCQQDQGNHGDG